MQYNIICVNPQYSDTFRFVYFNVSPHRTAYGKGHRCGFCSASFVVRMYCRSLTSYEFIRIVY